MKNLLSIILFIVTMKLSDLFTSLSLFVYLSDIAMNISSSQLYGEVSDHIWIFGFLYLYFMVNLEVPKHR